MARTLWIICSKLRRVLTHTHIVAGGSRVGGPLSLHVLRADLDNFELPPVLALRQIAGQETTRSMVKRHGALAGVNGGYSFSNNPWPIYHGDPRRFLALSGQVLSEPNEGAWSVQIKTAADDRQSFSLVQPQLHVRVNIESGIGILCAGVNRERRDEERVVYAPTWNRSTLADRSGVEVVVSSGRIKAVRDGLPGAVIPSDGFVVSERGALAQRLRLVDVHLLAGVDFELRNRSTAESLAWNARELSLVTVDGRQSGHSVGFTLTEFAKFLVQQEADTSYNMDGGGSTTMAIADEVVNRFSDIWGCSLGEQAIERRRCDALQLFQS